jgi:hypothetical protein
MKASSWQKIKREKYHEKNQVVGRGSGCHHIG